MKRILLALAAMFTASTVNAQEINPDPGFASSGSWMEMGQVANVAIAGGKVSFTGPNVMTSVSRADTTVKRGRWYRVGVTVSNYTSGSVQAYVGNTMMGGGTGSYVPAVDLNGGTAIADNFTYADGIDSAPPHVDGDGRLLRPRGFGGAAVEHPEDRVDLRGVRLACRGPGLVAASREDVDRHPADASGRTGHQHHLLFQLRGGHLSLVDPALIDLPDCLDSSVD